jgi:hypothetical protein
MIKEKHPPSMPRPETTIIMLFMRASAVMGYHRRTDG